MSFYCNLITYFNGIIHLNDQKIKQNNKNEKWDCPVLKKYNVSFVAFNRLLECPPGNK